MMQNASTVAIWLSLALPCVAVASDTQPPASAPAAQHNAADAGSSQPSVPAAPSSPPVASDLAQVRADIRATKDAVDALKAQSLWIAAIPIAVAVIALLGSAITLVMNVRMHARTLAEKWREEERATIRRQVDEFYAPFMQLRAASEYLYYEAFMPRRTPEEQEKYKGQSGHYRTILALADGYKFAEIDATLLGIIVGLGKQTADLIYTKIGLVADDALLKLLAQATTHFKLMEIAYADPARVVGLRNVIDKFTFPMDLDPKVREKLAALNARLDELQRIR